jgi:zinc transporter 9
MAGSGVKVVIAAVAGNSFITVIKFIGWFFSRSPSLLAESIHSLADTFNQILLLIGMNQSHKKATRDLPTGSGNARYLWNLISAVGIFFLGFGITAYHGLHALFEGH